jgi:hypothetical protein
MKTANKIHQTLLEKAGRQNWKYNGGGELAQSTLFTYMELSQ